MAITAAIGKSLARAGWGFSPDEGAYTMPKGRT
jgi:hypothetical protein